MSTEINAIEGKRKLKNEFYKVFKGVNPFSEVFNEIITERLIIYPTDGCYLSDDQFNAVIKAAIAVGDDTIYISEIESKSDCFGTTEICGMHQCRHWVVENSISIEEYLEIPLVIENAIYSSQGKWGLIISHEDHAVLGGTHEFIENFKMNYESWNDDIHVFEKEWEKNKQKYKSNLDWLPILISHIRQES